MPAVPHQNSGSNSYGISRRYSQRQVPIFTTGTAVSLKTLIVAAYVLQTAAPVKRNTAVSGIVHLEQGLGRAPLDRPTGLAVKHRPIFINPHPPAVDQPGALSALLHAPHLALDFCGIPQIVRA